MPLSLSVVPRRVMRVAPGRGCRLVFQYSSVGVSARTCHQNTQYRSISQPDTKGVWNLGKRLFLLFCSFPQMKRNTGVQKRRLSQEPEPRATPEAELGAKHTQGFVF